MKLRHKISLLAGAVLLLVLLTCAGVLLLYARKTILALAEDQARDKQSALSASFRISSTPSRSTTPSPASYASAA